jgi:hypothetical protein
MTFSDPAIIRERMRRASSGRAATLELGHAEARSGVVVRFELIDSPGALEAMLVRVVEFAANIPTNLQAVTDPGWWAGIACAHALSEGVRASIMRGSTRHRVHAVGVVARGAMLDEFPEWPLFRVGVGALRDLRSEDACRTPSDADLLTYAEAAQVRADSRLLRQMFEVGVLGWGGVDDRTGRRRIVGAINA